MANRSAIFSIIAFFSFFIQMSYGDCIGFIPQYYTVPLNSDQNNPAFIVSFSSHPILIPEITGSDTFYRSDLLTHLRNAYNNCDIAIIATVTGAIAFTSDFSETNQTAFSSESVTVSIETVLKGQVKTTWNFVKQYTYPSYKKIIDPQTGDTLVMSYILSHSEPRYNSIKNKRFLLFLKQTDITDNQTFPMPLNKNACEYSLYQYLLNNYNEIYFDGFTCDSTGKKVVSLPEMTCPYEIFKSSLEPSKILSKPNAIINRSLESRVNFEMSSYNLLGKLIRNSDRSITSGAYIELDKKRNNVLKTLQLQDRSK